MSRGRWCAEAWSSMREPRDFSPRVAHAVPPETLYNVPVNRLRSCGQIPSPPLRNGQEEEVRSTRKRRQKKANCLPNMSHTAFNQAVLRKGSHCCVNLTSQSPNTEEMGLAVAVRRSPTQIHSVYRTRLLLAIPTNSSAIRTWRRERE